MPAAWALVPIKAFGAAKSRLEGLLTRAECARLAEEMARDVLMALHAAPDITGIAILSDEPRLVLRCHRRSRIARLIRQHRHADLLVAPDQLKTGWRQPRHSRPRHGLAQ